MLIRVMIVVVAWVLLGGCGDDGANDGGQTSATDTNGDVATADSENDGAGGATDTVQDMVAQDRVVPLTGQQVTIPMIPVEEEGWTYLIVDEPQPENGVLQISDTLDLTLALGAGYPTSFEVELREAYDVACGGSFAGDPIDGITGLTDDHAGSAFEVNQISGGRVRIDVLNAGAGFFEVSATLPVPSQEDNPACVERFAGVDRIEATVRVNVRVRPVADVYVRHRGSCASRLTVFLAGTSLVGFETLVVDDTGEAFVPRNASASHPGTLEVSVVGAGTLTAFDIEASGLAAVRVDQASKVSILGMMGDVPASFGYDVDVVEVTALEAVDVAFELVGTGRPSAVLMAEGTYGDDGAMGWSNRILPQLVAGTARAWGFSVCSAIDEVAAVTAPFFEMTSLTSNTCEADNVSTMVYSEKIPSANHSLAGVSATLNVDGRCELRLEAPALNSGQGISASVAANFVNVADMEDSSAYPLCRDGEFALKCIQR